MIVTMKRQISGTRDGVDWPEPGGTIDVPDDEAATLIEIGAAEAVPVEESRKGARRATNEPTP